MERTPDEIKTGLEHCINGTSCRGCPYCEECAIASDCNPMQKDLQGYIQQLEAQNAEKDERIKQLEADKQQLEGLLTHMNQLRDAAAGRALQMEERVRQLEAERDALLVFVKGQCHACKFSDCSFTEAPCDSCFADRRSMWQWRGVRKEDFDA